MPSTNLIPLIIAASLGAAVMIAILVLLNQVVEDSAWAAVPSPFVSYDSEYDEFDEARQSKLSDVFSIGAPVLAVLITVSIGWTAEMVEPVSAFFLGMFFTFVAGVGGQLFHLTLKE